MRRLAPLAFAAAAVAPAGAADLDRPLPRAPAVVVGVGVEQLCLLGSAIDVYTAPATASGGRLPAGLLVEIVDRPFEPLSDLWVRLRAPRAGEYYGYVATASLTCI